MSAQLPTKIESLGVISLSVKDGDSASVRERATLSREGDSYKDFLNSLLNLKIDPAENSALLYVETCHRVELYTWNIPLDQATDLWLGKRAISHDQARNKSGLQALNHLVRVTSSLDSEVLGETQITGQVKDAAELSRKNAWLKGPLDRCVQQAFRIAKRIRSSTALGVGTVSVAHAAVDGLSDVFDSLTGKKALVVGAGPMALQSLSRLMAEGVTDITWINRNQQKITSLELAKKCQVALFIDLHKLSWSHDILVLATGCPTPILKRSDLVAAQANSPTKSRAPRVILDLGLPRNVESEISEINGFFLRNVDEFKDRAGKGSELRAQSVRAAELILQEELESFVKTWNNWGKGPLLGQLYQQIEILRPELLGPQIPLEKSQEFDYILRGVLAKMMHRLVEEVERLDDSASIQVIETLIRAWRPDPTWQQKDQGSNKAAMPQKLSRVQKPRE